MNVENDHHLLFFIFVVGESKTNFFLFVKVDFCFDIYLRFL